jgi:hypothetical protein
MGTAAKVEGNDVYTPTGLIFWANGNDYAGEGHQWAAGTWSANDSRGYYIAYKFNNPIYPIGADWTASKVEIYKSTATGWETTPYKTFNGDFDGYMVQRITANDMKFKYVIDYDGPNGVLPEKTIIVDPSELTFESKVGYGATKADVDDKLKALGIELPDTADKTFFILFNTLGYRESVGLNVINVNGDLNDNEAIRPAFKEVDEIDHNGIYILYASFENPNQLKDDYQVGEWSVTVTPVLASADADTAVEPIAEGVFVIDGVAFYDAGYSDSGDLAIEALNKALNEVKEGKGDRDDPSDKMMWLVYTRHGLNTEQPTHTISGKLTYTYLGQEYVYEEPAQGSFPLTDGVGCWYFSWTDQLSDYVWPQGTTCTLTIYVDGQEAFSTEVTINKISEVLFQEIDSEVKKVYNKDLFKVQGDISIEKDGYTYTFTGDVYYIPVWTEFWGSADISGYYVAYDMMAVDPADNLYKEITEIDAFADAVIWLGADNPIKVSDLKAKGEEFNDIVIYLGDDEEFNASWKVYVDLDGDGTVYGKTTYTFDFSEIEANPPAYSVTYIDPDFYEYEETFTPVKDEEGNVDMSHTTIAGPDGNKEFIGWQVVDGQVDTRIAAGTFYLFPEICAFGDGTSVVLQAVYGSAPPSPSEGDYRYLTILYVHDEEVINTIEYKVLVGAPYYFTVPSVFEDDDGTVYAAITGWIDGVMPDYDKEERAYFELYQPIVEETAIVHAAYYDDQAAFLTALAHDYEMAGIDKALPHDIASKLFLVFFYNAEDYDTIEMKVTGVYQQAIGLSTGTGELTGSATEMGYHMFYWSFNDYGIDYRAYGIYNVELIADGEVVDQKYSTLSRRAPIRTSSI